VIIKFERMGPVQAHPQMINLGKKRLTQNKRNLRYFENSDIYDK
jgi:hypothetical protein